VREVVAVSALATANGRDRGTAVVTPIGDVRWRTHARIKGKIRSLRIQPWADVATLEAVVVDGTGGVLLVFLGRRKVAGIELGREIVAEGMVGASRGYLAILNPEIELLSS
jgi:RecG-like helicase